RACNDLLFLALVMGSLNLLFRRDAGSRGDAGLRGEGSVLRDWGVAGALGGLAWMTRYNGSVLLPAALLTALLLFGASRRMLSAAGAWVGAWIVTCLPWLLFVMAKTGTPFWNKAYENIAIEVLSDDANRAQTTGFMSATNIASLKDVWDVDPGLFLKAMASNVVDHLRDDATKLVGVPWAIVAVGGLLLGWQSWRNRRALAFLATGVLTYLSLLPVFYNERFMLPLLPYWGAMAGGTAVWLGSYRPAAAGTPRAGGKGRAPKPGAKAGPSGIGRLLPPLLGAFGVLTIVLSIAGFRLATDPKRFGGMPGEYVTLLADARRRNVPLGPEHPIAARKPHFPYMAGSPTVGIPAGSIEQLRSSGAHYLLVSGSEVAVYPSLASIWIPKSAAEIPQGLALAGGGTWRRSSGDVMAATLYAVLDPLPYVKRESSPFKKGVPVPDGYSRVDFNRLLLGEWILKSGALRDPDQFFRLMSPAARELPRTRLWRGAAAIRRGDLPEAERLYRAVAEGDPANRAAWLGVAATSYLAGRQGEHAAAINRAFGIALSDSLPVDSLKAEGDERLRRMETPQSLAVATAMLATNPTSDWALKSAAYSLQALFRPAESRRMAEAVLLHNPEDREAQTILNTLEMDGGVPGMKR
ncbi:MAG TPA: hypothetical protein VF720_11235, partial [Candidatus Eisenbacteria bacterium]